MKSQESAEILLKAPVVQITDNMLSHYAEQEALLPTTSLFPLHFISAFPCSLLRDLLVALCRLAAAMPRFSQPSGHAGSPLGRALHQDQVLLSFQSTAPASCLKGCVFLPHTNSILLSAIFFSSPQQTRKVTWIWLSHCFYHNNRQIFLLPPCTVWDCLPFFLL